MATTAAVAVWSSIKMEGADGGLASLFDLTNVHEEIRKYLKETEEILTLRDFATSFTSKDHEDELTKLVEGIEAFKTAQSPKRPAYRGVGCGEGRNRQP